MKNFLLIGLVLLAGCSSASPTVEETAQEVIDLLVDGEFEKVHDDFFAEKLQESTSLKELEEVWKAETSGTFNGVRSLESSERGDSYQVVEAEIEYSGVIFQVRMTFDEALQLVGINLAGEGANVAAPDNVTEEQVVVGEGTEYELEGTLTLPNQESDNLPAVILVQGSGPSDRDEAVFSYKPFRDIAWGLAEQGIAVLRYDKRTYTYGSTMSPEELQSLTVYEETVEDAVRAAELLKNDSRIDSSSVYLGGHSLGGMLAPRIDMEGDFAGLLILAGSPRTLAEIIYDQSMAMLEDEDEIKFAQDEYEKSQGLTDLTKEEALSETVFGLPAYYFQEMDTFDAGALAADSEKPLLILQGEDDFQVYFDKDFAIWQEILADKENTTFISYPGLNHFFVDYDGPGAGTITEYEHPGVVDEQVIHDMTDWILKQTNQ
ncbi:alpha/beta fold hydrolase [Oceanobacillus polygoni]|uniref:Dienelactone hydrolase n=1 Tax=Oceanobacillus polygoni TaxID=1235259 RepID=A0A9X0YNJ4_9BACI|nr:alpha/beta fold hydrolase [Oceanobacillus polygoni]MBP2075917.1 dienelactone hydrolase [Oceanobacillus polygoni]